MTSFVLSSTPQDVNVMPTAKIAPNMMCLVTFILLVEIYGLWKFNYYVLQYMSSLGIYTSGGHRSERLMELCLRSRVKNTRKNLASSFKINAHRKFQFKTKYVCVCKKWVSDYLRCKITS